MRRTSTPRENGSSSAAFEELKQEVARLRKENEELRQRNTPDTKAGGHGHGHEGGGDDADLSGYLPTSFVRLALRRSIPLSFFLTSLSMTALVMDGFEHTLHKQLELAYFVPLLIGHSGNTGGQTVGTVLSVLTAGNISSQDWFSVVMKEAMSGLMIGILLAGWFIPLAMAVMGTSLPVAVVVGITIPILSFVAAGLAAGLPFSCLRLGLEPADIAAPAMTTIIDVLGLLLYFVTAGVVLGYFGIAL